MHPGLFGEAKPTTAIGGTLTALILRQTGGIKIMLILYDVKKWASVDQSYACESKEFVSNGVTN